jgi:signal peptidase I
MLQKIRAWFKKPNKNTIEQWLETILIVVPIAFVIRTFGYGLYQVPSESMETTMLVGERFVADKFTIWFQPVKHGDIISFDDPEYKYSKNSLINLWQRYVWGPSNWTKRVIGIPGDHIEGKIEDGKPVVYRNGEKLDEPYVNTSPLICLWRGSKPTIQDIYLGHCDMSLRSFDPAKSFNEQPYYTINPSLIVTPKKSFGDCIYDEAKGYALSYPATPLANGNDVFDVHLGPNEYWAMGDNRKGSYDSRGWGKLDGKLIHGKIKFRLLSIDSDEPWLILDILKNPISFWKKVRWSRSMQAVH